MRITVDDSVTGRGEVDYDVADGAALSEVVAEFSPVVVWCGSRRLDPEHRAGTPPLVAGAVLSSVPLRDRVDPNSVHLAAIAGPDAGVLIPLDSLTTVGSTAPATVLRDEACDPLHATLIPMPSGGLVVRDGGSVNGTALWVLRTGALRWRGRRHRAALRGGDVIAVGRTLLQVRPGGAQGRETVTARERTSAAVEGRSRWGRPAAALRRLAQTTPWRGAATLDLGTWPDPTTIAAASAEYAAPIAILGPHSEEAARAVILARGRRPPEPCSMQESWLSWLPDPRPDDGPIRIGEDPPETHLERWVTFTAGADGMTRRQGPITVKGPVVRVREDTAQALVRSMAGSLPEPPPRMISWAHAASLAEAPSNRRNSHAVVAGVRIDGPLAPWHLDMGRSSRLTLIAGTARSGKTTLLATIAGALAVSHSSRELSIVMLCVGEPGPLEPYLRLPHVSASTARVGAAGALSLLESVHARDVFTVVIADDLDRLGPDGRAVAARLESLALQGDGSAMHVIMATERPTAVFTPSLRAAQGTAVALRAERPLDSVEVIGTDAAYDLPHDSPGRALVRRSGRIDAVQVALPWADAPRVTPWGATASGVRSLADAAHANPATTAPSRPGWRDPEPPAS